MCELTRLILELSPLLALLGGEDVLARIHSEKKPRSQLMNFLVNEEVREKSRKLKDRNKVHKLFRRHFKVDFLMFSFCVFYEIEFCF